MGRKILAKKGISILAIIICSIFILLLFPKPLAAAELKAGPNEWGALHVEGTNIVDEQGDIVRLKGISLHGINYFPQYINQKLFNEFSDDWGANLVRVPLYVEGDYGYTEKGAEKEKYIELVKNSIEYAKNANLYVIVDWHCLDCQDEEDFTDEAIAFFEEITSEYADYNNIIYEIYNEPAPSRRWSDIKQYAEKVIPVIRKNDPNSIIVVGTPDYSDRPDQVIGDRIEGYDNIMYTFHFYASSHEDFFRGIIENCLNSNLPIFITECGITERDGSSSIDYQKTKDWFYFIDKYNLSCALWNFSNKDELSAMIRYGCNKDNSFSDIDLTNNGQWVKSYISTGKCLDLSLADENKNIFTNLYLQFHYFVDTNQIYFHRYVNILFIAIGCFCFFALINVIYNKKSKLTRTYNDLVKLGNRKAPTYNKYDAKDNIKIKTGKVFILLDIIFTLSYLIWRGMYSIPFEYGIIAIICNVLLLIVEAVGFFERLVLNIGLASFREYETPQIDNDEFPDVDIFIATYNEPVELLRKTINGCTHMAYPDKSKVHIYICDDNRRPAMKALAQEMGVGYFDRPDNKGAKAGNLNNALAQTSSPYIVTFDADMIPRHEFLLKTIPFFVDAKLRNDTLPPEKQIKLGLLQTPQSFYTPDLFQYSLYEEKNLTNEQDFFYRTIEVARTASNSVIYGGSNTIIAREALDAIGGFYTESITEDFATGLLIETNGFVSIATGEPLASGEAPIDPESHIKQRIRWGRGVLASAKQIHLLKIKGLSFHQRTNYLASVLYWLLSFKNYVYILSPLVFAILGIFVFKCSLLELILFWLPSFLAFNIAMKNVSRGKSSTKWSRIYDMVMTPFLFFPMFKETIGKSLKEFQVTDKSKKAKRTTKNYTKPFTILLILSIIGLIHCIYLFIANHNISLIIIIYWIILNILNLIMARFVVMGRDFDEESVIVTNSTEFVSATSENATYDGIATQLTEHSVSIFFDEPGELQIGDRLDIEISNSFTEVKVNGLIINITSKANSRVFTFEIMDFYGAEKEYWQIIYDRIPSTPQSLRHDGSLIKNIIKNAVNRMAD